MKSYPPSKIFDAWFAKRFGTSHPNDDYLNTWKERYHYGLEDFLAHMDSISKATFIAVLQEYIK